jgi:DNA-binding beta-propeller fold protein YncE
VLVSNFNNSVPTQGTGTTIIKLTPNGQVVPAGSASVFFQGPKGLGLTTALGVLRRGFVLVGSVPTTQGTFATIQPGSLLILDSSAKIWYTVEPNAAAVILGPTGLAYDAEKDVLYVASTADNAIFAIPNAGSRTAPPLNGTGTVIFQGNHLRGPLALVLAPNGDLITSNGDAVNADVNQPSEIVEFTKDGKFIGKFNVDPAQGGAFGIAVESLGDGRARFAAVNDNTNDISVYTLGTGE